MASYRGDGILVFSGDPQALERNAERAVRSALDIVDPIAAPNTTLDRDKGVETAVRIGIAAGTAMVGDAMAQERTVIGEAPTMAARTQALGARNGIVIGALIGVTLGAVFLCEDLGAHDLNGFSVPVQTRRVAALNDASDSDAGSHDLDTVAARRLSGVTRRSAFCTGRDRPPRAKRAAVSRRSRSTAWNGGTPRR